jgi:hypothetical protein
MAAGEEQNIAEHGADSSDHTVSPRSYLCRRLAARTAVAKELPIGPILENFGSPEALIVAVIPFDQIPIDLGCGANSGQLASSTRSLHGACKDFAKRQISKPLTKLTGVALSAFGQRQIGRAGVLTRQTPFSLTMSG